MNLMIAAAVKAGIGPRQRIIPVRVNRADAAPLIAASPRARANIGAGKRIRLAVAGNVQGLSIRGPGQKCFISGIIGGGHISAGEEQSWAAGRHAGAIGAASAIRLAGPLVRSEEHTSELP